MIDSRPAARPRLALERGAAGTSVACILAAMAAAVPAFHLTAAGLAGGHGIHSPIEPTTRSLVFGVSILGAAFLLAWAAEVAEIDIPKGLAIVLVALIAVLPEYAVDLYFAYRAASEPEYTHFAAANMTGSNRILVGFGWAFLAFLHWFRRRHREIRLSSTQRTDVSFLMLATIVAFVIPTFRAFSLWDTLFLFSIFAFYSYRAAKGEHREPELVGPAAWVGTLRTPARRGVAAFFILYAATAIWFAAEPFAESLLESGKVLGIDEFLLVQWLAPLASEAPEFLIAAIWTWRGDVQAGFGTLLSSKVNQWTLLLGSIPVAYSIGLGETGTLHQDDLVTHEMWLTGAQSLFAVLVLADMSFSLVDAALLFGLFLLQLLVPDIRLEVTYVYFALSAFYFWKRRTNVMSLFAEIFGRGGGSAGSGDSHGPGGLGGTQDSPALGSREPKRHMPATKKT